MQEKLALSAAKIWLLYLVSVHGLGKHNPIPIRLSQPGLESIYYKGKRKIPTVRLPNPGPASQ